MNDYLSSLQTKLFKRACVADIVFSVQCDSYYSKSFTANDLILVFEEYMKQSVYQQSIKTRLDEMKIPDSNARHARKVQY